MAYVEHGMWEVLDVLKRHQSGERIRQIARNTGRDRKTVKRYILAAAELGWVAEIHAPDEALAQAVMEGLRPGKAAEELSQSESLLLPHLPQIREWLSEDPFDKRTMTLTKTHELLHRQGLEVSYGGLRRFAMKHLGHGAPKLTVRMSDVSPGEVCQVDFGRLGKIPVDDGADEKTVHALVVTLVYSRHQYVHLTHSQKLPDLLAGLDAAWMFFGGIPARVIIDNMKTAVLKADRYDPVFQRTFNEYKDHHGFTIDAAESRSPTQKPHVERNVPYVRENFFRGEQFLNLSHAQAEADRWCLGKAGLRIHGTTRRKPLEEFEAFEKTALKPANLVRFDPPKFAEPKVHPDCHVRFSNALYSVPHACVGKTVTVRGDSSLVRIYAAGILIKTHPRVAEGKRATDVADYPEHKSAYTLRDANYLIRKGSERGPKIGEFLRQLLSGDFPWAHLRQAQKLHRLCDRFGDDKVNEACLRSLAFELVNVTRLEIMLKNAVDAKPSAENEEGVLLQLRLPLPTPRHLRLHHSFKHNVGSEE
jgi:transposase